MDGHREHPTRHHTDDLKKDHLPQGLLVNEKIDHDKMGFFVLISTSEKGVGCIVVDVDNVSLFAITTVPFTIPIYGKYENKSCGTMSNDNNYAKKIVKEGSEPLDIFLIKKPVKNKV
jgi:hypothetical protein